MAAVLVEFRMHHAIGPFPSEVEARWYKDALAHPKAWVIVTLDAPEPITRVESGTGAAIPPDLTGDDAWPASGDVCAICHRVEPECPHGFLPHEEVSA